MSRTAHSGIVRLIFTLALFSVNTGYLIISFFLYIIFFFVYMGFRGNIQLKIPMGIYC